MGSGMTYDVETAEHEGPGATEEASLAHHPATEPAG